MKTNKKSANLFEQVNSAKIFRDSGYAVVDLLSEELERCNSTVEAKTINWDTPDEQLKYWQNDFNSPKIASPIPLFREIMNRSINMNRRGNVGHQIAVTYPITSLTSALIAHLNNGMGVYEVGMTGNAMENIIIRDLSALFGLPEQSSGFVTSGGSLGNLTAMLTAKSNFMHKHPDTTQEQLAVLVSEEAHYSIDRVVSVIGLPKENIIKIPVGNDFRMKTELLDKYYQITENSGKKVFCIIGCACSTSTGAFDDLVKISKFAGHHKIWFHVDAAHGGPVIFSDKYKQLLKGIENADSIIMDFHKMMSVPSLSTALFYRNRNDANHTFSQDAKYLWQDQQSDEWYNSGKQTFECTKPMTIVHVYTILRLFGYDIYKEQIDLLYGLSTQFAKLLNSNPDFEVLTAPQSNIVCFRYIKKGADLNELNKLIQQKIVEDGTFYMVGTLVKNQYYLRTSLMNTRTTMDDLTKLMKKISIIGCN